jgi:hypothetical protein
MPVPHALTVMDPSGHYAYPWEFFIPTLVLLACVALAIIQLVSWRASRAEEKGLQLFLNNLTADQRQQYYAFGYFDVLGSHTGKCYRIHHGTSRNVTELESGGLGTGRCFMPVGELVPGDCMLAQKIALENCEEDVLRTAIRF